MSRQDKNGSGLEKFMKSLRSIQPECSQSCISRTSYDQDYLVQIHLQSATQILLAFQPFAGVTSTSVADSPDVGVGL